MADPITNIVITIGINAAFNAIFGSTQNIEGPRLSDLKTTTSEYGAPIPIVYGNARRAGQVIWGKPLREEKRTETPGKKGGGKGPSLTTYSYYATWAVGFCRSGTAIRRLWFDKRLVYDANETVPNQDAIKFRFYPGSETQDPDPIIVADKGTGNAPAYRDWCYIVFEDVPLDKYGNRIPSVEAEVMNAVTVSSDYSEFTLLGSPLADLDTASGAVNPANGDVVVADNVSSPYGFRTFSLLLKEETRQSEQLSASTAFWGGPGGRICRTTSSTNTRIIRLLDAYSGAEIAQFGVDSGSTDFDTAHFPAVTRSVGCSFSRAGGYSISIHLTGLTSTGIGVLGLPGMTYEGSDGAFDYYHVIVPGDDERTFYAIASDDTAKAFSASDDVHVATYAINGGGSLSRSSVSINTDALVGSVASGTRTFSFAVLDQTDSTIIVGFARAGNDYVSKIDPSDGTVVWSTLVSGAPSGDPPPGFQYSRLTGGYFGWYDGAGSVHRLSTLDGSVIDSVDVGAGAAVENHMYFDAYRNTVFWTDDSKHARSYTWDRVTPGETAVSDIVDAICQEAGLDSSDVDVTDLSGLSVRGYTLENQAPARNHIEPLRQAFFFDPVESDYQLKFVARGGSSARTIEEEYLLDTGKPDAIVPTALQELELPRRYFVTYNDFARDYEPGLGRAQRVRLPDPSMATQFEATLQLPVVFSGPDAPQQIAEKALYNAWAERRRFAFNLPTTHLDLDPTDIVTLELIDGTLYVARLSSMNIGADFSIEAAAVEDQQSAYASNATGSSGSPPDEPGLSFGLTEMHVLNCPLLRDLDDEARVSSHGYVYAGGFGGYTWSGCIIAQSTDGTSYSALDAIINEACWGTVSNALGTPNLDVLFGTDEENTLTVYPVVREDALVSVTQLEMVNGANTMALLKLDGTVEIIRFRDVTDNSDGSYTLSGLMRGTRGTDTMAYSHTVGETFVLIDEAREAEHTMDISRLGQDHFFRAVGKGAPIETGDVDTVEWACRDLQPYAPWGVTAQYDGNDIDIAWTRRTRINGELLDGIGVVPLNEDSEAYEVDVLDGPGGAVVQTLTVTSEAATYLEADITADFGTPPSQITVKVYQVSAQVGRGFAHEVTLEL